MADQNIQTNQASENLVKSETNYDVDMLSAFEYFLSQTKTQDNLIQKLIKDYTPKIQTITKNGKSEKIQIPGSISIRTIFSIARSFFKAPLKTMKLLSFYQEQEKYNTPEFQKALMESSKTSKFIDNIADNLEYVNDLMVNMNVDLFKDGQPLDKKGMNYLKDALKNPKVKSAIKDLTMTAANPAVNNLELASKLLEMMADKEMFANYFENKAESIQSFITNSVSKQIEQDAKNLNDWNLLLTDNASRKEKSKFLDQIGITDEAKEQALKTGNLPPTLKDTLSNYGMEKQDLDKILEIVPSLINQPLELKSMVDALSTGEYYKMAENFMNFTENNSEIKEYFTRNSSIFESIITTSIKNQIAQSKDNLSQENAMWQKLDTNEKRAYLDNNETWKSYSDVDKDKMIENGRLQNLGDKLERYGIEQDDLGKISGILMSSFDNPAQLSSTIKALRKGDYVKMVKNVFTLFEKSPKMNELLKKEKDFIGKLTKANVLSSPDFKNVDVSDLVPFLLNHPKELSEIVKLSQEGAYMKIAPKILELSKEDRSIANYLEKNKVNLANAALKSSGYDKYGLSAEIADIFIHLTTETNLPKLQKLAEFAAKEQWIKVGIGLTDLIDKDQEFKNSLAENKENINKIVDIMLLKNPSLRSALPGVEVGTLANNIISNPDKIRDILVAYEKGSNVSLAVQAAKLATSKIFDAEFRGAVYKSAINYIYGKGAEQQNLANGILEAISKRENTDRVVLSDFVKQAFDEIADNIQETKDKEKFLKQIDNKNFFERINIEGSKADPLKLNNLDIRNNQFVNTNFKNVSFSGSKITGASFHGAKFENVDFSNTIIDDVTLVSLIDAIRDGSISLENVKIEGSLDGLDLSNISFKGADLSAITSMKATNLTNADFSQVTALPPSKDIITSSFGMENAKFADGVITQDDLKLNSENLSVQIASQVAKRKAAKDNSLSRQEKKNLEQKIGELYNDKSIIGKRFREAINSYPKQLFSGSFPLDSKSISHVNQYKGQASHQLTMIYNNIDNLDQIEEILLSDYVAEIITSKLFGEGKNRGQDGLQIQEAITKSVIDFANKNRTSAMELIDQNQELIPMIVSEIKGKTKYTTAGMVTSGIYLPDDAINDQMIQNFTEKMELLAGDYKLTDSENKLVHEFATSIATNIFGESATNSNKADIEMIKESFSQSLYEIKADNSILDTALVLDDNKGKIVGSLDRGYFSTSGEGLTKLFYDNATVRGNSLSSGYIKTENFKTSVKDMVFATIKEHVKQSDKVVDLSDEQVAITSETKKQADEIGKQLKQTTVYNSKKLASSSKISNKKNDTSHSR